MIRQQITILCDEDDCHTCFQVLGRACSQDEILTLAHKDGWRQFKGFHYCPKHSPEKKEGA